MVIFFKIITNKQKRSQHLLGVYERLTTLFFAFAFMTMQRHTEQVQGLREVFRLLVWVLFQLD